jgi:hypothetical protein
MGWLTTTRLERKTIGHGMEPKIFWSANAERVSRDDGLNSGLVMVRA